MNRLNNLAVAVVLALGVSSAEAATISLMPISGPVASGGQVTFDIVANFGVPLVLAGGTDYSWNPSLLTFVNFSFSPALASPHREPALDARSEDPITHIRRPERFDLQTSSRLSVAFGNSSGLTIPNDTVLGTLTFKAVGSPGSAAPITLADSIKWSGYLDFVPDDPNDPSGGGASNPISVTYTGATVHIQSPQVVPLPAAAWLLGTGMLGLLGAVRRSHAS